MPVRTLGVQTRLRFKPTGDEVADFARWCETYLRLAGGRKLVLRPWQLDIVRIVWGPDRPKLSALAIGRGNAKSTLAAAMALYRLYQGDDETIDILAVDHRQAGLIGKICAKFVARHEQLEKRAAVFADRIAVRQSVLEWLPANAAALEGRTPTLVICDEGGRIDREVYEVAVHSVSKVDAAQLFLIGTPGPNPRNVLAQFREHSITHPEDRTQAYMEFSADRWDHSLTCDDHDGGPGCLSAANPALGDWLSRESLLATAPPKTSEAHWRRVRLIQWRATNFEPVLPVGLWESLSTGEEIPPGSKVVLSFDGSYSGNDATVVLAATVEREPHLQLVKVWARPSPEATDYRVPIEQVEQTIRDACREWDVAEIICDSYRWQRSLSILEGEGLPVRDFPQSIARMSAATAGFLTAARNAKLTHSGHPLLGEHIANATTTEDSRGGRLVKSHRSIRIDAAICAVMAVSRATWLANKSKPRRRVVGF